MSFTSWLRIHGLRRANRTTCIVYAAAVALAAITLTAPSASAAYVTLYGGPTYTPSAAGFQGGAIAGVNDAGTAVGTASRYDARGVENGYVPFRWDGSGTPAAELVSYGMAATSYAVIVAQAINDAGAVVGFGDKYNGISGEYMGSRAVRWDASGTVATELGNLGADVYGVTFSEAYAINDAGAAVGFAEKWEQGPVILAYIGTRAVRWDGSATAATELGNLGTYAGVGAGAYARAINDVGTAVGWASKFDSLGEYMGLRAVRWDGSGTAATELGNLGTDASGYTYSFAVAINDAGSAVGGANMYDGSGVELGNRAVRWDGSDTAATELGNLGGDSAAAAINDAGAAVGWAFKYDGSGVELGNRAVRWDASNTAATELGNLGTDAIGYTESFGVAINDFGAAVGSATKYDGAGTSLGVGPVYWGLDGVAVDLNTLVDPTSGWTLNQAHAISNTGWIGGSGIFDPDGPGGQEEYARLFLMQILAPSDLPGDYDGNGTVGPEDFNLWKENYGSIENLAADGNGNGVVDAADYTAWRDTLGDTLNYNLWKANFGAVTPGIGADIGSFPSSAVPEPTQLMLLMLAATGWCLRRRRAGWRIPATH